MNIEVMDAPTGMVITPVEMEILKALVDSTSNKSVAVAMGIPTTTIAKMLRKEGFKEFLMELRSARNEALLAYAINIVADTLQDKMAIIEEDDDKRLGSSTRKDPVEIAKTLAEMLKGQVKATQDTEVADPMAKIYQQINILQGGGK